MVRFVVALCFVGLLVVPLRAACGNGSCNRSSGTPARRAVDVRVDTQASTQRMQDEVARLEVEVRRLTALVMQLRAQAGLPLGDDVVRVGVEDARIQPVQRRVEAGVRVNPRPTWRN
jgi:hypothetical protein